MDCIALAVYSNSQAAVDIVSESGIREPLRGQSHNILNQFSHCVAMWLSFQTMLFVRE